MSASLTADEKARHFEFLLRQLSEDGILWWIRNKIYSDVDKWHGNLKTHFIDRFVAQDWPSVESILKQNSFSGIRLIPLRSNNHNDQLFFLLANWWREKDGTLRAQLQLWIALKSSEKPLIGVRMEVGDPADDNHGYPHVQFCQTLGRSQTVIEADFLRLPVVYPAFPLPARDAVDLLLGLLIATRGYAKNSVALLQAPPQRSVPARKLKYHRSFLNERLRLVAAPSWS